MTDIPSSFYRPAAYALAQVVVDVPLVLIQVVLIIWSIHVVVPFVMSMRKNLVIGFAQILFDIELIFTYIY